MEGIQTLFDRSAGTVFTIPPGEHQGPLVIRRSCTVEGAGATLWADRGPALVLDAKGVMVRGLRIELVGRPGPGARALEARGAGCRLEQVEVHGSVTGIDGEAETWSLPRVIDLGTFAAEQDNSFVLELQAPQRACLENLMEEATLSGTELQQGSNRILLHTGEINDNIILYGEILVRTEQLQRRIFVKGEAVKGAPLRQEAPVQGMELPQAGQGGSTINTARPQPGAAPASQGQRLVRGQRVSLQDTKLSLKYKDSGRPQGVDLNCFVFCLDQSGRAKGDEALVFFNQPHSADGAVQVRQEGGVPQVTLELDKTAAELSRYVISLALYEPPQGVSLGSLQAPQLVLEAGAKELYCLPLEGLGRELVVNAVEIYRYKNEWRLSFVGAGYEAGLGRLCQDYGLEVQG